MGGDFNALLEFADGEDGEEDDEKLPSNLFNVLDADEEERLVNFLIHKNYFLIFICCKGSELSYCLRN